GGHGLLFEDAQGAAGGAAQGRGEGAAGPRGAADARCALGQAAAGRAGELHGVDQRWEAAAPQLPGAEAGQDADGDGARGARGATQAWLGTVGFGFGIEVAV